MHGMVYFLGVDVEEGGCDGTNPPLNNGGRGGGGGGGGGGVCSIVPCSTNFGSDPPELKNFIPPRSRFISVSRASFFSFNNVFALRSSTTFCSLAVTAAVASSSLPVEVDTIVSKVQG